MHDIYIIAIFILTIICYACICYIQIKSSSSLVLKWNMKNIYFFLSSMGRFGSSHRSMWIKNGAIDDRSASKIIEKQFICIGASLVSFLVLSFTFYAILIKSQ